MDASEGLRVGQQAFERVGEIRESGSGDKDPVRPSTFSVIVRKRPRRFTFSSRVKSFRS